MALRIRELTSDEQATIEQLAHARTTSARAVERARMIWHASQGLRVPAIAQRLNLSQKTVRQWLKRFNVARPGALEEHPARVVRPHTRLSR